MKKVAIIINKNWETEPMLAGMISNKFRPATLPFPVSLLPLRDRKYTSTDPRAVFRLPSADGSIGLEVKVFCIQDLMDKGKSSSSSEEKYRVLPTVLEAEVPDLVIAAGTAGYVSDSFYAGNVVIGSRFFIHNGHPGNPDSNLNLPEFEQLLSVNVSQTVFDMFNPSLNPSFKQKVEGKFLKVPNNPASRAGLLVSTYYTAVGSVNVTDYAEYAWVDKEAIEIFRKVDSKLPIGSLETTHGVIRLSSSFPCIFVSAITDREGHFEIEVTPGQNYVASFNAGIVLGQLIADLSEKLKDVNFAFAP